MLRLCLAATLLCLASALPTIENADHPGRVPGEYLVVLKPAPEAKARYVQDVVAKIRSISADVTILSQMDNFKSPILHLKADDLTMNQALHIPEVAIIEANVFEKRIEQCGSPVSVPLNWGLDRVDQRNLPLNNNYSPPSNGGANVDVYVLDTGIRTSHNEFQGRARFGEDFAGTPQGDRHGHGTHCAGTVGGSTVGVAKQVGLVDVSVLNDQGSGSTSNIIAGINWVIGDVGSGNGIISMSLGGGASDAFDAAVNNAVNAGIPVVVAAGNSNANACNFSPARATGAITIASSMNNDARSSFSNIGTCCDLFAPGSDIRSAGIGNDSSYTNMSGTSMACPHVAGAAAALRSANPGLSPEGVRSALSSSATPNVITNPGSGSPNLLLYVC